MSKVLNGARAKFVGSLPDLAAQKAWRPGLLTQTSVVKSGRGPLILTGVFWFRMAIAATTSLVALSPVSINAGP